MLFWECSYLGKIVFYQYATQYDQFWKYINVVCAYVYVYMYITVITENGDIYLKMSRMDICKDLEGGKGKHSYCYYIVILQKWKMK